MVTELVSSYYTDGEHIYEYGSDEHFYKSPEALSMRSRVQLCEEARPVRHEKDSVPDERKPQLSWFLNLFLLTSVTVVSLLDD